MLGDTHTNNENNATIIYIYIYILYQWPSQEPKLEVPTI